MLMLLAVMVASCASYRSSVYERVREMSIEHVDPSRIPDGKYRGEYSYTFHTFVVETTVKDGRIVSADLVSERDYEYSQKAAGVLRQIVQRQTPKVDAVTGATTTSKALMKAAERGLRSGASKAPTAK